MKNKNEVFYPPEQTKVDTIKDEQAYLAEKLGDLRKEYEEAQAEQPRKKTRKQVVLYALGAVLLVLGVVLFVVGVLLKFLVEPDFVGLIIISVACLVLIAGLLMRPRKALYKPLNPFNVKLIKPDSIEVITENGKNGVMYAFFFDYSDETGELYFAMTETKFNEEEKQKICSSFANGNTVVAVSNNNNSQAVIVEY